MVASFATAQDVEARTAGAVPASDPFVQTALDAASQRIRNVCGWHVYPVVAEPLTQVSALPGLPLWLPTVLLVGVDGITVDDVPVTDLSGVRWWPSGEVEFTAWGVNNLIAFTHGYAAAPADLVSLTIELALGDLASRMGAVREQSLSSSVTWARASGQLSPADVHGLSAYRLGYVP